jgi:hypothetical protein
MTDIQTSMAMWESYKVGNSLAQVTELFGVTRQTVYERLHRRGMHLRSRVLHNPIVEFDGNRYSRVVSGYYAGYYRKTLGNREMLHHAVWRKANGGASIPDGHVVHIHDNNRASIDPDNMELLLKGEDVTECRTKQFALKRCLACGAIMGRYFGLNHRECPAAYEKRKTCNARCSADWKMGKPRGSIMPGNLARSGI